MNQAITYRDKYFLQVSDIDLSSRTDYVGANGSGKPDRSLEYGTGPTDKTNGESEFSLVYADLTGPKRSDEYVYFSGSSGAVLRLSDCRISIQCSLGNERLPGEGEGVTAPSYGRYFAGSGFVAEKESLSQNL